MSDNTALKEALRQHRARETDELIRLPVNIPVAYKNKLKVLAAVEQTTMRDLIIEAIEDLFEKRGV